jgi:hypothetical protein
MDRIVSKNNVCEGGNVDGQLILGAIPAMGVAKVLAHRIQITRGLRLR